MKTFLLLTGFFFCLAGTAQAQDHSYVPNARQAVQKSRMQQPQYFDLTKDSVESQQSLKEAPAPKPVNYQAERPIAIDAPKRRGKKSQQSSFAKLASYSKR